MEHATRIVEVKELPETTVAYVRHVGPYQGDEALFERLWNRLFTWAGPRGLVRFPETQMLIVYHDSPEITDGTKLRTSVCLSVPADTEVDGEIGKMNIPGGKYALARFELGPEEYQEAWNWVYGGWLPGSGYEPDDRPPFELYHPDDGAHGEKKKFTVDICIPVRPV